MGRKILFSFLLIFLCMGFSLTLDQLFSRKNVSFSSPTSSSKEVVIKNDQQNDEDMKPVQNFTVPITQALTYNLSKEGHLEKEPWNSLSHHSPVNVSMGGIPCILFWAKRITVKFKNQTWLDLRDEAFGQKATVDTSNSNCSEESASLSLKFGDAENPKGLDIRFILTSYNKLSMQSWFSLHRVEIVSNDSVRAVFAAAGVRPPRVAACGGAAPLRRRPGAVTGRWEAAGADFQIQGFAIKGVQFPKARDCASSFSPAVLIGLATSLILLLALAYALALHVLIYPCEMQLFLPWLDNPVMTSSETVILPGGDNFPDCL
ncbi:V-type proton ATPase subunit S1-like [Lemur catta]|uniref:V-type proton ATPase subunit S1-like n=1 Tax=Lemur catta TaxID=9447 RepID=UPI001E26AC1E|nr:V-type proton ATPase subunit S1-like [Lemur catta]